MATARVAMSRRWRSSAVVEDEGAAVGGEGVARKEVAGGAGFLVVALDGIEEPSVRVGEEVAEAEAGLAVEARGVDEEFAVGRDGRAEGRAYVGDDGVFLVGPEVAANDVPEGEGVVVVEAKAGFGFVVEGAAVGRGGGAEGVIAVGLGRGG